MVSSESSFPDGAFIFTIAIIGLMAIIIGACIVCDLEQQNADSKPWWRTILIGIGSILLGIFLLCYRTESGQHASWMHSLIAMATGGGCVGLAFFSRYTAWEKSRVDRWRYEADMPEEIQEIEEKEPLQTAVYRRRIQARERRKRRALEAASQKINARIKAQSHWHQERADEELMERDEWLEAALARYGSTERANVKPSDPLGDFVRAIERTVPSENQEGSFKITGITEINGVQLQVVRESSSVDVEKKKKEMEKKRKLEELSQNEW